MSEKIAEQLAAIGDALRNIRARWNLDEDMSDAIAAAEDDVQFVTAGLRDLVSENAVMRAFVHQACELTCCAPGADNSPCRLNESSDPNEFCLYHLAVAVRNSDPMPWPWMTMIAERDAALKEREAVEKLHVKCGSDPFTYCQECSDEVDVPYPCPTIRAMNPDAAEQDGS